MKAKHITSIISFFFFCLPAIIFAQDWPQFLGSERNSTSLQKNILRNWPEQGPEILWSVNVGIGYGGPIVKSGKIYLLDRDDKAGDIMRCFNLSTGKELWKFAYDAPGEVSYPGSRSVPIVDEDYVYSCGAYGDLYCIDIKTQKNVWNKNIWTDFGGEKIPVWAVTQNPLIYNNLLIVASQAPQAGVVAYNKLTGDLVWKTPNLGNESYVSPTVVKIDGEDHVVMVTSTTNNYKYPDLEHILGNVVGIDPLTGKILWKYSNWNCVISVPPVVDAGDNKLLITGGYELGATMIKVEKQADGSYGTTELFTTEEFGDQTKPPILYNGYFYAQYGTNSRRDGLTCMSMDGEIMWKTKRDPNFNKGSMILADGLILATDGARTLYLIEPSPTAFKPLAKAELLENGQNWAPIALAEGRLLIRDREKMLCIKVAE